MKPSTLLYTSALLLSLGEVIATAQPPAPIAKRPLEDLEINADSGVTCNKEGTHCKASGNISVKQGPWEMTCHHLDVTFNRTDQGMQEVKEIQARDQVHIFQKDAGYDIKAGSAFYQHANQTLDLYERPVLTQKGNDLEILNSSHVQVLYPQGQAIAKGRPTVKKNNKLLQANTLTMHFTPGTAKALDGQTAQTSTNFDSLDAQGDVILSTPTDIATGDKGHYVHKTQQGELLGNVVLAQCDKAIQGNHATFDMKTGQAQMLYSKGDNHRVQAILSPHSKKSSNQSTTPKE